MRAYLAVTDPGWHAFLARRGNLEEINFWQPTPKRPGIELGSLVLFKLRGDERVIVGGGLFLEHGAFPAMLMWDAFRENNGAPTFDRFLRDMSGAAGREIRPADRVGALLVSAPVFLPRAAWISVPKDKAWRAHGGSGNPVDLDTPIGQRIYAEFLAATSATGIGDRLFVPRSAEGGSPRFGTPSLRPTRLGQAAFRALVTETYDYRCVVTRERTLPALQAAHIKPVSEGGEYRISNGLLLRADLHALFDAGYVAISPERQLLVSPRIKAEFENGHEYYNLRSQELRFPKDPQRGPDPEMLDWHLATKYRG